MPIARPPGRRGDELAQAALDDPGDEEHQHGPARELRPRPAGHGEAVEAVVAAGKQDLLGDDEPAGTAQDQRADLGQRHGSRPSRDEVDQQTG